MTTTVRDATTPQWLPLDPTRTTDLADARLQFHHAAQLAAAVGISFVPRRPDDSHTNLEWITDLAALASRLTTTKTPFRLAVRPAQLALLLLDAHHVVIDSYPLHAHTIENAATWVRGAIATLGADPSRYTLERHYVIPAHPVGEGGRFDTSRVERFEELSRWYADAAGVLERLVAATPNAAEVRCWPHHFDMATLIDVVPARGSSPARTVGVGMEPGDTYYAEPYFYINMSPSPERDREMPALAGGGTWHRHDWIGAVLPGSRLQAEGQRGQAETFIGSGTRVCSDIVKAL